MPSSYKGTLIKKTRYGQFTPETSRFVFDLSQPVQIVGIDKKDGRHPELVITIAAEGAEKPSVSQKREEEPQKIEPKKTAKEAKKEVKKPHKPEKPLIAIDPGHGGVDPGTIGPDDIEEKDITLEYAKLLKAKLLKSGHYRVMLTRDDDDFIMLRQRVALARKAGASLFISIHADSAPDDVRGLSVYTVSEKASDQETAALAARENKADVLAGVDLSDERNDVAGILISLAERETMNRSALLADLIVTSLDGKVRLLSNTHRFAGFAVLKAPDIPSVLVETGFLSEPQEEKLLSSKAYREKVTGGITAAVDAY
ncbi:MAG: N-acetylmuramoyl-L-alanine amidase, partial [Pseudomonadota bacterium]|nr:N-acetylmuramoyl-L-alanine amidase [Pseudomonadota bacterium]